MQYHHSTHYHVTKVGEVNYALVCMCRYYMYIGSHRGYCKTRNVLIWELEYPITPALGPCKGGNYIRFRFISLQPYHLEKMTFLYFILFPPNIDLSSCHVKSNKPGLKLPTYLYAVLHPKCLYIDGAHCDNKT